MFYLSGLYGLYKIFVGIILGIIQGVSEWLPISSKTQILLASTFLLHINFAQAYTLGLFLEIGTFVAAVIYFRRELLKVVLVLFGKGDDEAKALLKYLVVVTLVTVVIAVPIYLVVSSEVTGPVIGLPMIVLGILLVVDWLLITVSKSRIVAKKEVTRMSLLDFVFVGVAQGIAALPGISRSGATVSTLLFLKVKPGEAFRLSFFAGILATLGATGATILLSHAQLGYVISLLSVSGIVLAIIVSAVISIFLIGALIRFAGTSKMARVVLLLGIIAIASGTVALIAGVG